MTKCHAEFPNFMQNLLIVRGGVWSQNWAVLGGVKISLITGHFGDDINIHHYQYMNNDKH